MISRKSLRLIVPALLLGSLAACSGNDKLQVGQIVGGATKQVTDVQPVGGFLPDASLLNAGDSGQFAQMYRNPNVDLTSYRSIILDPVELWIGPNSQVASVPYAERQALANTFTADLYQALKTKCRMARQDGPNTAHFKFALVDAETTNPVVNTVATYTPYLSTAYSALSFGFNNGVALYAGGATIEGYAVDSRSGTLLWQGVDKRAGTTALLKNTLNSKLDIELAFKTWSKKLLTNLQQLGVCTA